MQIVRVIKYTVLMLCFYTILSTVTTLLIGSDSIIDLSFYDHVRYQLLPSFILGIFMYGFMAKREVEKAWLNALSVYLIGFALGFLVVSGLMQELYLSPTLVYEIPLSVISMVIGTILGVRLGSKGLKATYCSAGLLTVGFPHCVRYSSQLLKAPEWGVSNKES